MTGIAAETVDELFDVILSRPSLLFGSVNKLPRSVLQRAKAFEALATNPKREMTELHRSEQFLLPKGEVVVGGIPMHELQKRLSVKPIIVNGEDKTASAIRDLTGTIRMDWSQPNQLGLHLPRQITDEQVKHLSRFFDNNQVDNVAIHHAGGESILLNKPLGAQVEDALFSTATKYAKKQSRITPELIAQYKATGVFKGQAGLLEDGSPVEVRHKKGDMVTIFDRTANKEMVVHESKMSLLPTTLDDQIKPNNLFVSHLPDEERVGLARLRQSLATGLGTKITKFPQLELLAGSRGFVAERLTKGKVALVDMTSGERQQFENLAAATAHARSINRPAADLTPDVIKAVLGGGGETNIGFVGLNGRPPLFGETIPTPTNLVFSVAEERNWKGPTAYEYIVKPMRSLFQRLQERTGLPFGDHFLNIQQQTVLRQNFNARWHHGKGRALPNSIKSLDDIRKLAGRDADAHAITAWLESGADPETRQTLEKSMSKGELSAAQELRKFYDELFTELQVPRDYIENYAPHIREAAQKFGTNDFYQLWKSMRGQDAPLPKGADFFADHLRTGVMDIYDTDAFRVASRYLHAGSSKRFMSAALDDVSEFLNQVPDRSLVKPMSEYLEALRGFEFIEQKQMLERTLGSFFNKLPGIEKAGIKNVAEKLSDMGIGLSYMSTLGYRLPSVLRNYTQVLHTTYAVFGSADGAFMEGLGRAMTQAGKLAAVEDGAISFKSASVFGRQELEDTAPWLKKFADGGFKLYDNADEFTRAASYWVGRENASRAIQKFANRADSANPARSRRALDQLLLDSKAFMFEKNIQNEFIRRMANDPESASRFLGKQVSDVTQFLYGRGMQPYWMRSVWGKFLGQYGTWPIWYLDYLARTTRNYVSAGHTGEAIKFLGRNALVNAAFLYAGHEVLEIDLSRWLAYPALFYAGGPGAQVAVGAMQLMRGLSDQTSMSESEFAKSHVTEGMNTLVNAGLAFVPFRSAARDMQRVTDAVQSGSWTELLASMLGARPTQDYTVSQQLDALFPGGPLAYEEWQRYSPRGRPGQMSASALSEQELYRLSQSRTQNPRGPSSDLSAQRPSSGIGSSQGQPPNRLQMGLSPLQIPQKPKVDNPEAESEPLNR